MTANAKPLTLNALSSTTARPITVAYGDGIGPEIMKASLRVLTAAGANIAVEEVSIGESVYRSGNSSGIDAKAWKSLQRTKVFYKGPITTPQGGGYKSLNVTIRKSLGLYANVRPCTAYAPFVPSKHPTMDVVIVRENEEDLYAGIEHRQTDEVYQCLKLVSRSGCERIVRYAFEYARANGRRKVTCFTKDNIMKMTDGLFHRVFDQVGADYPGLEKEHMIVDIGAARLADSPGNFDVIVMPNLYGDILSDVAAQIAGSVGLAGSANVGAHGAMFEAIHGSAPDLAGKNLANPSGLLLAGAMMLQHIGQATVAAKIHNAWLATIEDGIHTADIFKAGLSTRLAGTQAFADAVIARLGRKPRQLAPVAHGPAMAPPVAVAKPPAPTARKELVGADIFLHWHGGTADDLARLVKAVDGGGLRLQVITNRGVKVWPQGHADTVCTDHWRCRFVTAPGTAGNAGAVWQLLQRLDSVGLPFIKVENLYDFDGVRGYSLAQGQ
jgi:isocitrate dehydrogenase